MADAPGDATALSETERLRRRVRELERVVAERGALVAAEGQPGSEVADAREQARALEERLRTVTRSAREAVHLLSNDLTLAVGYVELLQWHAALPPELRELVRGAGDGLATASQHLEQLHRDLRAASEPTIGS